MEGFKCDNYDIDMLQRVFAHGAATETERSRYRSTSWLPCLSMPNPHVKRPGKCRRCHIIYVCKLASGNDIRYNRDEPCKKSYT